MPALSTITMVQDADRCIEGLRMMHADDAVLFRGAFGPVHFMPILHRRGQVRQVGAPNQLKHEISSAQASAVEAIVCSGGAAARSGA